MLDNIIYNHTYNEDCMDTMKRMKPNSIHLTVTSPPYDDIRKYNGEKFTEFKKIAEQLYRITKKGGVTVWIVSDQTKNGNESGTSFTQALHFKKVGFNLWDTMIYLKSPQGARGNNSTYWQAFEYMFVFSKGTPRTINLIKDRKNRDSRKGDNGTKRLHDGRLIKQRRGGYKKTGRRTNAWEYLTGLGHSATDHIAYEHPAIFPEKLVRDHIISWTNKNNIVYDPFMGSGTTAKMCIKTGRRYVGSEINRKYHNIIKRRLKKAEGT